MTLWWIMAQHSKSSSLNDWSDTIYNSVSLIKENSLALIFWYSVIYGIHHGNERLDAATNSETNLLYAIFLYCRTKVTDHILPLLPIKSIWNKNS